MVTEQPRWVDSHCHLFASEDDPAALLERADHAGIDWLMCPGIDLETSLQARRLSIGDPRRIRWAAGLHPHDATRWAEEGARLTALIAGADGIGECGLDYYRDLSPRAVQRDVFGEQLRLASELDKPIIVHCRDAFSDVFADLEAAALGEKAILHSWTGGPKWTKRFAALGQPPTRCDGRLLLRRRNGAWSRPTPPIYLRKPIATKPTSPPSFPLWDNSLPRSGVSRSPRWLA